ncbi:hypothetical protein MAPG_06054 [Magnaporthiopsis poae ATCC 64411]|uniref:Uncharacterized protein n=1 Tax=Magnaporthiopsis poae (strain ATCC 64411 / 73-15) TaxID=644358 RepID=A0A0C4E110_MAGP6|nr:hypothetical protein MAPG_06054 [Magnaporthiopsis poae ATCC 64411]
MVSTKSLVLLTGAIAPAVMAGNIIGGGGKVRAPANMLDTPPMVFGPRGPVAPENVPNTVPTMANFPNKYTGNLVQFWKAAHFQGEYASTDVEKPNRCYGFTGKKWADFSEGIVGINIVAGGPCYLYEGRECNRASVGPFQRGYPITDLEAAAPGWGKKAQSISCKGNVQQN